MAQIAYSPATVMLSNKIEPILLALCGKESSAIPTTWRNIVLRLLAMVIPDTG